MVQYKTEYMVLLVRSLQYGQIRTIFAEWYSTLSEERKSMYGRSSHGPIVCFGIVSWLISQREGSQHIILLQPLPERIMHHFVFGLQLIDNGSLLM